MIKLLIVDDEESTRLQLKTQIDWDGLQIKLVAVCTDGLQAYEQAKQLNPDIIIADINMPGMNGLDLIEKLRSDGANIEFILLSGYAEFSYAHRALTNHVTQYLLKPCSEQNLVGAVQRAIHDLMIHRQIKKLPPIMEQGAYGKTYSETVQLVLDYLEAHYADSELSLKQIANQVLFMNPDYVGKQFFAQTGKHFVEYLQELRIRKAQWMLAGDKSPDLVAQDVGYGHNPQYFRKLFSHMVGMTPRAFAKYLHDNQQKTENGSQNDI